MPQHSSRCEAGKWVWSLGLLTYCGEPVTGLMTVGCVHEHITVTPVCDRCQARGEEKDSFLCMRCTEAGASGIYIQVLKVEPIPAHQDPAESGSTAF